MRLAAFILLTIASFASCAAQGGQTELKHDWRKAQSPGVITFTSNHPAPPPYSNDGEPEARLAMEVAAAPDGMSLQQIMDAEVAVIRRDLAIADYGEEDGHKPDKGIVSYIEQVDGHDVAFIKYRVSGAGGRQLPYPRSIRHALLVKKGKVYYVHLMVVYADHWDEVTGDQMRLVRAIISH